MRTASLSSSLSLSLALSALYALGCQPEAEVRRGSTDAVASPASPSWSEPLSGVSLLATSPAWALSPMKEVGGITGLRVRVSDTCEGQLLQERISGTPQPVRAAALEARLHARLAQLEVRDVIVRDRGEVPHGTFSAFMLRVDGLRAGSAWSARLIGSFVTRSEGRFYVEIVASSRASGFVVRRTCFDTLGAAVTIRTEER
jgi:hypothetical protein